MRNIISKFFFTLLLLAMSIGSVWGATTLFSTNFSTTDGWSNENLTTSSQTETTKTIKGTTITIHGYKSASAKVSSANTTSGTFTFTSNNISPSDDVSASNINYYMAIPVSGIVGGAVTVTITTSSAYKPYYIYRDGLTGDFSDRLQAAVNNTFTITDLTNTSAIIYLGTSGKTMTSLTITTPQLTDLTASAFYQLYANAEKTYDKLIEDASFPSYISTNIAAVSSESGNSSSVATPHDFTALGSGTYYRLKTANNNKIELEALSHVKSIRLYGNGNGSSRTVTVTASKISGTGTAPTISSMSMVNSKKTVVEYTTGDLTALTGYNVNTYYTYTLAFPGAADIWGIYIEYAAPACQNVDAPTGLSCTAQTVNSLTYTWTKADHASGYTATLYSNSGCTSAVESKELGDVATVTFNTGLSASTDYWCKVQSKGNGTTYCAEGGVTSAAQGTTATPSCGVVTPPTYLQAGSITAEGATLLVTDAADAMNYEFYISEESTGPETSATATHTSTTKEKAITGLTSGTTYYAWVRSVCDNSHKSAWTALTGASFITLAEPTATFNNSTYDINGGSPLDLTTLWSSNSEGVVTYTVEEVNGTGATISTAAFTATTAGTAKVKAVQAANGNYTEITKYAYITVGSSAMGTHTLTWNITVKSGSSESTLGTATTDIGTSSVVSTSLKVTSLTDLIGVGVKRTTDGKNGNTGKIETPGSYDADKYVSYTFNVASGYTFTPSAVSIKTVAVGDAKDLKFEFNNSSGSYSVTKTNLSTDASAATNNLDFSECNVNFKGTVTVKMYVYGATSLYRLSTPLTITGTLAEVDVTAPTLSLSVPADEATGIDVSGNIVLTMSENVSVADASKFSLTGGAGSLTTGSITVSGAVITIPYTGLANNTDYTFTAAAGAIKDGSNNLNAAFTIGFKTAASGVCVKPDAPIGLGVDVKTNNYAKFSWDGGSAGANGYQIALTSEAVGATGKFDWKDEATAIYEATNLTPATEYTFKVKYKGTVDDCFSDEVTETFTTYSACTKLVPETSGEKPEVGDEILLQMGSAGGKIVVADKKDENSFSYSSYGLLFNSGGKDSVRVELNSLMKEGTVIALTIVSNGTSERGLNINKTGRATVYEATWTPAASGEEQFFTYVVTGSDGLKNTDKFWLARNGSVYLKSLTVSNCGDAIYDVTFDMKGHGTQVAKQTLTAGAKVAEPSEPEAAGYIFGGWYKETTLENAWNFSTDVVPSNDITLYAKWTEDPCTDRQSLSKVVLTSASEGTVTGYNGNEYAGTAIIASLKDDGKTADIIGDAAKEKGYKLNSSGNSIVMATLKKGDFQEGDKVTVGVILKNDQRTVDASTDILTLYAGSDKDHMMEVATIKNVSDPGFYTYRLTAANATAINAAGYKSIGLFRASSNGENHNIYSVEITGCRSWTTTHTVTYNKMGKGADIAPAVVAVGDLVPKPSVVEPDGWALAGWYKEEGLVNEWNFASDVMPDNNLTLYAKWEDETGVIKLFSNTGVLNTTNFVSAAKKDGGIDIDEVNYPCLVDFGSNRTSLAGTTQADVVQYNATTNTAKIKLDLYNNATGAKTAYLWMVEEGATESGDPIAINVPGKTRLITSYTSFNSEKPRSFYVTSGSKADIKVLQVKVMDNGTDIPQFGKAGYAVNLNKGRIIAAANGTVPFDGATMHSNDAYTVLNSSNFKPKTYIQFTNAVANTIVRITKASSNAYYVTNDLEHKGDSYTTDKEITLTTTGTWYIGSVNSGSTAAFSAIEFIAPKCEQPNVTDMSDSELCEGDAFAALNVTASVSDGGTLHYQWYKEAGADDEAVGTDAASYTPTADGQYYVVVTNKLTNYSDNSATSNTITVEHFASAVITTAPLNQRGEVGDVVTLSAAATGKNVAYKWYTCDEDGSNEVALDPAQTGTSIDVTITAGLLQWYKVKVTSDCGGAEAKAKVSEFVPTTPANVTTSILWDWKSTEAGFPTASTTMNFTNTSVEELFADVDAAMPNNQYFRSDMLYGIGQIAWRNTNDGEWGFQGKQIRFKTEVAGKVRVYYRAPSSGQTCTLTIDGKPAGSRTNSWGWSEYVEVDANTTEGIVIAMSNSAGTDKFTRVQKIEFIALAHRRTAGYNVGDLGTVCLEDATFIEGANLYELAGLNENGYLAFDEVLSGELEEGKPYLFEVTNPSKISFYKPVGAAHSDYEIAHKGMIGTFSGTTLYQGEDNLYYFSGRHIWKVNDFTVAIPIPDHRCYVDYDAVQAAGPAHAPVAGRRRVKLGVQGTQVTTDINNVGSDDVQCTKVMIDGQLYILRGEKMYDATGRLVK